MACVEIPCQAQNDGGENQARNDVICRVGVINIFMACNKFIY